jgi:hypothetical protein
VVIDSSTKVRTKLSWKLESTCRTCHVSSFNLTVLVTIEVKADKECEPSDVVSELEYQKF